MLLERKLAFLYLYWVKELVTVPAGVLETTASRARDWRPLYRPPWSGHLFSKRPNRNCVRLVGSDEVSFCTGRLGSNCQRVGKINATIKKRPSNDGTRDMRHEFQAGHIIE